MARAYLAGKGLLKSSHVVRSDGSEDTDTVSALIREIRGAPDESARERASKSIQQYLVQQSRETPAETFQNVVIATITKEIFTLVNSEERVDKTAGIYIIDALIDFELEHSSNALKITRLSNYLTQALDTEELDVMELAAQTLGKLVRFEGNVSAEIVDSDIRESLRWLREEKYDEYKKQGAVLVLESLAVNAPSQFYVHISDFFEVIWVALNHTRVQTRECAAKSLKAALELTASRKGRQRLQWHDSIWQKSLMGLKTQSPDTIHGSLLAISELLANAKEFMINRVKDVYEKVLRLKDFTTMKGDRGLVRRTVILMMPRLAAFTPEMFYKHYFKSCMEYLLEIVSNREDTERSTAFLALGRIVQGVSSAKIVEPYLAKIVGAVKTNISNRKSFCFEAVTCLSMLSVVIGVELTPCLEHEDLLPVMFCAGLNEELTKSLNLLGTHIPSLMYRTQVILLHLLSYIITKKPYTIHLTPVSDSSREKVSKEKPIEPDPKLLSAWSTITIDEAAITLALRTLGSFGFQKELVLAFTRDVIVDFLDADSPLIRREAVIACANIVIPVEKKLCAAAEAIIGQVIEKLLIVGIADTEPSIRTTVLDSLNEKFDAYLGMPENLRSLFIALNDEVFDMRKLAIRIIGRLTLRNPAYVMPSMRKTLVQLLTELEFSGDSTNKEESTALLGHLINSSKRLIRPYCEPILTSLLSKLDDENPRVASAVLQTTGELSMVSGKEVEKHLHRIFPIIIDNLQDQSSTRKRQIALRALGNFVKSTGRAITPLHEYPRLMDILLNMIKTERLASIREDLFKVLGILGALDPFKYKFVHVQATQKNDDSETFEDVLYEMSPSSEEYAPTAAIVALMKILADPSLGIYHNNVIDCMLSILADLEPAKIEPLVPLMMPPFLNRLRSSETSVRETLLLKLGEVVSLVREHSADFLGEIFDLIITYWGAGQSIVQILGLINTLSAALGDIFKVHLPDIIPQLLNVLHKDHSETGSWGIVSRVLHTLEVIAKNLDDYLHLVIPALVRLMEQVQVPVEVRKAAILTVGRLSFQLNFEDYASRIGHPLARILETQPLLRDEVMDTLCALIYQLWTNYAIVIQVINKVLIRQKISHPLYENLVSPLLKNLPRPEPPEDFLSRMRPKQTEIARNESQTNTREEQINEIGLQKAWQTSNRTTKEDWNEWMRKFSVELLRNSSSRALRKCFGLAQMYHPLATRLFNPAFLSVWTVLGERMKDQLVQILIDALSSSEIPPEIMQILLNCFEWMERDGKPLTAIDIQKLGRFGNKCHAYAKALHYKEIEFRQKPDSQTIEELISLNNQLQQPEAAVGILTFAQKQHDVKFYPSWYEKLQRWNDALEVYQGKELSDETIRGRLHCYHSLGEWEQLLVVADQHWESEHLRSEIAPLAASSAWHLGNWDRMAHYVKAIDESFESSFYRAILEIHNDHFVKAQRFIDLARHQMDNELTALVGESYHRAYDEFVKVQQLAEMEEIILYKQSKDAETKEMILQLWETRLAGCQRNVDVWERILSVRSLVLSPKEDPDMWLKFAKLCRKSGALQAARKVVVLLLGKDHFRSLGSGSKPSKLRLPNAPPDIVASYLQQVWAEGDKKLALDGMVSFSKNVKDSNNLILQARCNLKLGLWRKARLDGLDEKSIPLILETIQAATRDNPQWYKAWHEWAYINYEVLTLYDKQSKSANLLRGYLNSAIKGFFRCISLSPNQSLQDTLRVLTLWFKYGDNQESIQLLKECFDTVSIDTWLQVIPQLIARIHSHAPHIRVLIQELLIKVGRAHPQALVFPLTVASIRSGLNSPSNSSGSLGGSTSSSSASDVTQAILNDMKKHSPRLVEQVLRVSSELIRVSIVWHEMWHEALEEASRFYYNEHNTDAMLERLAEIHRAVERGPETLREVAFEQLFGRELTLAHQWCLRYQKTKSTADINQAWDIYSSVFRRIVKMMGKMKSFDLEYVSPYLFTAHDLDLAIPGTYRSGAPVVKIKSFNQKLKVFSSKQRPRQTSMEGSDGQTYNFLLKGHEDLRQDERVMQLFGLVNTLLDDDAETCKSHLNITRFSVVPLSPNSGLIGWVPNTDTLLKLIQDYRESEGIELRTEHKRVFQMIPAENNQFDNLTLIQKVEIFEFALAGTKGDDINKVLWLKSRNAESWLERRLTYTRSLAMMSMVGYILGLGDRHPSNLMLDRINGKIVHIDFGDCFEVAMTRDKYPEKVPFRLTRMLINAMEVSEIEGNFRTTCENVMRVMRANKESLMAVLEAFVHDPLLNWRLLGTAAPSEDHDDDHDDEVNDHNDDVETDVNTKNLDLHSSKGSSRKISTQLSSVKLPQLQLNEKSDVPEVLNEKAVAVITRVQQKLTGTDFSENKKLTVDEQVAKLIEEATSSENLSQSYSGWCPYW